MTKFAKEYHDLTDLELLKKETELREELFNLRFRHSIKQLENPLSLRKVRKQIAVVKTVLREREIAKQKEAV
ncbi:MAG: 50S ribosomal protein L29 [Oscillospiraceae bacterium]|jgi:large subunit ribosomal protein L29|nr:50S ribosomal protein L29 [Oscillospiraceae bacterium]